MVTVSGVPSVVQAPPSAGARGARAPQEFKGSCPTLRKLHQDLRDRAVTWHAVLPELLLVQKARASLCVAGHAIGGPLAMYIEGSYIQSSYVKGSYIEGSYTKGSYTKTIKRLLYKRL